MSEIIKRSQAEKLTFREQVKDNQDIKVIEGYALLWEPYLLYDHDGIQVYEKIERSAFENCDFKDTALKKNHENNVYARVRNGSLTYEINSKGVFFRAELKTPAGHELYEEVKQGLYDKTSWAFVIDEQEWDKKTRTQIIKKVKKCMDFSVVTDPANYSTSVWARAEAGAAKPILQELQVRKQLMDDYIKEVRYARSIITTNK